MKTVRDIVTALACDGATVVSILGALPIRFLDAIVIGCEECDVCRGKIPLFMSCGCGRGKSFVVNKEAREAARRVVHIMYHATGAESAEAAEHLIDDATNDIARALLGGEVYEAKAVLEGELACWCGGTGPDLVETIHVGGLGPGTKEERILGRTGDALRIAVLKQGGE